MRITNNGTRLIATACETMATAPVGDTLNYVTAKGVMRVTKTGPNGYALRSPETGKIENTDHNGLGLAILSHGY